ncbi:MAG: LCCL domain-containing protein [Pseudomonadota bacterium]|nr:LCCL domain-containing protein [Pseudomonadota bacterium]
MAWHTFIRPSYRAMVVGLAGLLAGDAYATNAREWRGLNGKRVEIRCEPEFDLGSIWGTDVYTDDTDVCTAAAHAGVITRLSGGTVLIEIRPGRSWYPGSTRNDITSGTFPEWGGSFVILAGKPPGRRWRS